MSAARRSKIGIGSGALPDTSSRAERSARASFGESHTRLHTVGTPKYSDPPAAAYASGVGPPGVHQAGAETQRPEHAEHEAVHVEQRQAVHERVLRRPRPRVGEPVEPGGDRRGGQHDALRRPRRPGRVDDHHRPLLAASRREPAATRGVERDDGQTERVATGLAEERRRPRVADDVLALQLPRIRREGDDRDAGEDPGDDGDHRLHRRRGVDDDGVVPGDGAGQPFRLLGQRAPRTGARSDRHGVGAVPEAARQGRQQLAHRLTMGRVCHPTRRRTDPNPWPGFRS